jgi:predicted Zn-dependent peptidase
MPAAADGPADRARNDLCRRVIGTGLWSACRLTPPLRAGAGVRARRPPKLRQVVGNSVSSTVVGNGLPLIQMPVPGRLGTAVAIAFPAGSRHEKLDEVGVAHLLEHLAFKGTEHYRTATDLNRAAEYLGTELEGVSTTDYVEFSTAVRAESVMPAIELLVEVVGMPLLAETELAVERGVIVQEITDENENPASRAGDLVIAALFPGHRLAKSITGEATDVQRLTHDRVLAFRERQWSPTAGLAVIAGNVDHLDRRRLESLLREIPGRSPPPQPTPLPPFRARTELEQRDGDVVHLRLAYSVPGVDFTRRRDRAVAEVFSQLIGGPMGSRLFDELREQRGLCYWVDGHLWGYESATFLSVSCSVHPDNLEETFARIQAILGNLRVHGPTAEEARRFSAYSTGAVTLDFESSRSRLDHAIELILEYGDHDIDPVLHLREIESITGSDLANLASKVELRPCVGCVGPATAADFA